MPSGIIELDNDKQHFLIAEIGKNFIQTKDEKSIAEYLENAKALVSAAAESGADAVKFQTHVVEDEVLDIDFTSPHFTGSDRYSWVRRNEAITPTEKFWNPLKEHCLKEDVHFFSTPMSRKAAIKLDKIGVPFWKVGSGDVQDYVLLDYLIDTKKPIIISTGMVSLRELDEVIKYITKGGTELTVLYCVSKYPCPPEDFNLGTIEYLKEKYPGVEIGFSDHSITHDAVKAALKLGVRVIEKHFSFDRLFWGSDHKASLTPSEFKELVYLTKTDRYQQASVKDFYGDKDRELEGAHNKFRPYFNKGLVASRSMKKGESVNCSDIYAMRPIKHIAGFAANKSERVLDKILTKDMQKYTPFSDDCVI